MIGIFELVGCGDVVVLGVELLWLYVVVVWCIDGVDVSGGWKIVVDVDCVRLFCIDDVFFVGIVVVVSDVVILWFLKIVVDCIVVDVVGWCVELG